MANIPKTGNTFVDTYNIEVSNAIEAENVKDYKRAIQIYKNAQKAIEQALRFEKFPQIKESHQQKLDSVIKRIGEIEDALKPKQLVAADGVGGKGKEGLKDTEEDREKKFNDVIIQDKPNVKWEDIAGLEDAKHFLREAVVLPRSHPELFTEGVEPWKGILLFGPPGTGKSFLAKAVATEVDASFFSISAADITSKWIGEGEKNVKELFVQARKQENSIIFIDEIDSIAGTRGSEGKSESSKNILTQLLVQLEGVGNDNSKLLFLAATNTPWSLDSAILRRLQKRVYIPLPDPVAREALFRLKLGDTPHNLTQADFQILAQKADGYSGSDISNVVQDALMQPVRILQKTLKFKKVLTEEIIPEEKDSKDAKKDQPKAASGQLSAYPQIVPFQPKTRKVEKYVGCAPADSTGDLMTLDDIPPNQLLVPPVTLEHIMRSLQKTRSSVLPRDVKECTDWGNKYGTGY